MATEQLNTVIESEIGGSPICEAVKKMADVLFETVIKPDYENDIYTDELEGGDDLDSSMATDADRMQAKYGTPMSVVDEKDIVSMPKDERIGDEGIDPETMTEYTTDASDELDAEDILIELSPYTKTSKVSEEDKKQLVYDIAENVYKFFETQAWEDPEAGESTIQEYLNNYKCSYDDFLTVKSYIDEHNVESLADKLFNVFKLRIRTIPFTVQLSKPKNQARLYRHNATIEPQNDVKTVTVYVPALLTSRQSYDGSVNYIVLDKVGKLLQKLPDDASVTSSMTIGNNDVGEGEMSLKDPDDMFELIFAFVIPQLAKILEPEEAEVSEEDEYDDSMSPGNDTPEDAYTDYDEVRERSIIDSVGTKLPGDIYNPTLIEAVDHLSEALFEG